MGYPQGGDVTNTDNAVMTENQQRDLGHVPPAGKQPESAEPLSDATAEELAQAVEKARRE